MKKDIVRCISIVVVLVLPWQGAASAAISKETCCLKPLAMKERLNPDEALQAEIERMLAESAREINDLIHAEIAASPAGPVMGDWLSLRIEPAYRNLFNRVIERCADLPAFGPLVEKSRAGNHPAKELAADLRNVLIGSGLLLFFTSYEGTVDGRHVTNLPLFDLYRITNKKRYAPRIAGAINVPVLSLEVEETTVRNYIRSKSEEAGRASRIAMAPILDLEIDGATPIVCNREAIKEQLYGFYTALAEIRRTGSLPVVIRLPISANIPEPQRRFNAAVNNALKELLLRQWPEVPGNFEQFCGRYLESFIEGGISHEAAHIAMFELGEAVSFLTDMNGPYCWRRLFEVLRYSFNPPPTIPADYVQASRFVFQLLTEAIFSGQRNPLVVLDGIPRLPVERVNQFGLDSAAHVWRRYTAAAPAPKLKTVISLWQPEESV